MKSFPGLDPLQPSPILVSRLLLVAAATRWAGAVLIADIIHAPGGVPAAPSPATSPVALTSFWLGRCLDGRKRAIIPTASDEDAFLLRLLHRGTVAENVPGLSTAPTRRFAA